MSADYDLVSNMQAPLGLILATRTATAATPTADTKSWKSIVFGHYVGIGGITFDATNRMDVVIQESDDDSTWTEVVEEDLILPFGVTYGTAASGIVRSFIAAKAAADTAYTLVGYRGKKRYARQRFLFAGTHGTGTPVAAVVIQGHPMHRPAWQADID